MRLVAWPSTWKEEEGLLPIDVQEIDLIGTPDEIRSIAAFLVDAASQLEASSADCDAFEIGIDLGDSKPNPQTAVYVNVVRRAV